MIKQIVAILLTSAVSQAAMAQTQKTIHINAMVCSLCEKDLAKELKALPSVDQVQVDFKQEKIVLRFKDGAAVPGNLGLTQMLTKHGVAVESIE